MQGKTTTVVLIHVVLKDACYHLTKDANRLPNAIWQFDIKSEILLMKSKCMKHTYFLYLLLAVSPLLVGCNFWMDTVSGNGHITTEKRSVAGFSKLSFEGPFDVEVVLGEDFGVSIEAEENLTQYININKDGDRLRVKVMDGINLRTRKDIRITVSMPIVESISFSGSGKVQVKGVIKDVEKLNLSVAGSGDIIAALDCPEVEGDIAGAGSITLNGTTRKLKLDVAGAGDCKCEKLLAEEVNISIAGSGNAWVYASLKLDVSVAGSGDIYYRGNPAIKQSIAGSGDIKKMEE